MALAGMASRFAVLPDDDTTDWVAPKSKKGNSGFIFKYTRVF
jgi:hypothetical protein